MAFIDETRRIIKYVSRTNASIVAADFADVARLQVANEGNSDYAVFDKTTILVTSQIPV